MNITFKVKNKCSVSNISYGKCFKYGECLYMAVKTPANVGKEIHAVDLETGNLVNFKLDTSVYSIKVAGEWEYEN